LPLQLVGLVAVVDMLLVFQVRLELQTKVMLVETVVLLPPDLVVVGAVLVQLEVMALPVH
jgi:hypothetical protein